MIYDTPQYKAIEKFWREPDFYFGCAYGLPVVMLRNWSKAWCGYVGVPASHPHFALDYSERVKYDRWTELTVGDKSPIALLCGASDAQNGLISLDILYDAPGGLTYARDRAPRHTPDGYWWFGFDCNHYNDLSPRDVFDSFSGYPFTIGEQVYRDFDFTQAACRRLASQLTDFSSSFPEQL